MDYKVHDGQMDVAILAGPRLRQWPTQGVRVLSRLCSDAGLRVGWYGGPGLKVRGVLPFDPTMGGSGAVAMVEDAQKRLHRIQGKTIVKIIPQLEFPLPFQGWYSPGLIPESSARKLIQQGKLNWQPIVVILGTGNRAFRLGSELIQTKVATRVVCVESVFDRVQGWEVERRRFEILGGKVIFGKLLQLLQKNPFLWELKVQDAHGTRILDTARVISVGPFESDSGFREYPVGSYLMEWENTEVQGVNDDVEQVLLDENRAVILAARIIKGLVEPTSEVKSWLERKVWASKQKLRELEFLEQNRFFWGYDGKWLNSESKKVLETFPGTLKTLAPEQIKASIECVEAIGCRACQKVCPADAIKIERAPLGMTKSFLIEDACTGCGFCLQVCPSQVPVMIEGDASGSYTRMIFPYHETPPLKKGDRVGLLNRKGDLLASSRVVDQFLDGEVPLFKVDIPSHLIWDVRGLIQLVTPVANAEVAKVLYEEGGNRVEIQIQGDVRRVREGQLVSSALFEIGMSRPNDLLICEDGSCGLCQIDVDGVRKFACETTVHQGMSIRFTRDHEPSSELCPCENVETADLVATCEAMRPDTIEALSHLCEVGKGKCHGLICKRSWTQLAMECGVKNERSVDWSFPWVDWVIK